mmetsp:Transcript_712/g.1707  ORF Transcript_712/g.1707 Transcript_712/m.1707 type:complete len:213 (+) Transcript_712:758-1396(+)
MMISWPSSRRWRPSSSTQSLWSLRSPHKRSSRVCRRSHQRRCLRQLKLQRSWSWSSCRQRWRCELRKYASFSAGFVSLGLKGTSGSSSFVQLLLRPPSFFLFTSRPSAFFLRSQLSVGCPGHSPGTPQARLALVRRRSSRTAPQLRSSTHCAVRKCTREGQEAAADWLLAFSTSAPLFPSRECFPGSLGVSLSLFLSWAMRCDGPLRSLPTT